MRMSMQQTTLTIDDMIALDPRIGELLNEANIPTPRYWEEQYSHFKRLLSQHIGFHARIPVLQSCACYETMIRALCALLPEEREGIA